MRPKREGRRGSVRLGEVARGEEERDGRDGRGIVTVRCGSAWLAAGCAVRCGSGAAACAGQEAVLAEARCSGAGPAMERGGAAEARRTARARAEIRHFSRH